MITQLLDGMRRFALEQTKNAEPDEALAAFEAEIQDVCHLISHHIVSHHTVAMHWRLHPVCVVRSYRFYTNRYSFPLPLYLHALYMYMYVLLLLLAWCR
jgi:hypothetical protein